MNNIKKKILDKSSFSAKIENFWMNQSIFKESKLNGFFSKFREEIVTTTDKLIINEDHWNSFPVVFFTEFFSFLSSFRWLSINVLERDVIVFKVICNFSTVWTVIVSQYNNFCHWSVNDKIIIPDELFFFEIIYFWILDFIKIFIDTFWINGEISKDRKRRCLRQLNE